MFELKCCKVLQTDNLLESELDREQAHSLSTTLIVTSLV